MLKLNLGCNQMALKGAHTPEAADRQLLDVLLDVLQGIPRCEDRETSLFFDLWLGQEMSFVARDEAVDPRFQGGGEYRGVGGIGKVFYDLFNAVFIGISDHFDSGLCEQ